MQHASPPNPAADARRGLWLGVLGVFLFALTIPMTRLAGGPASDPQLDPLFVALGRAAVAGLLSLAYLMLTRAPWPTPAQWPPLALTASCVVFGFPLLMGYAVREVDAIHASVISGLLPLATAVMAALVNRQRASLGFWLCALAGTALVIGFAAWRGGGALVVADAWLLGAVLAGALGYVSGARLSAQMKPEQVISWALVLALPMTLPVAIVAWPTAPVRASAWLGFGYVALFSMWLGFFAWYRALALGGALRVSQVQLLQPFLSMLLAVPLLGEKLDLATVGFALAVMGTVWLGRRMPAAGAPAPVPPAKEPRVSSA
ncbi:DMT family transporter [Rivibacter subsaxonicus]|uniref:Drug/metabolite transporter (DMT)-like permease n=1 Tax=Rivibacter subsaxonicus TaxID=457575 RepID=A0A4Q7VVK1_9BURK|nr:DMT family transporter [Rivibacter subsaxonicus]RZU00702.1 drug/metabolite transporter (DMT)-like permease [Rivibacter subsaxonicus]